jgi:rubrerythrin
MGPDFIIERSKKWSLKIYNDTLMLAMKREEKALQLYTDLLDKADSEESRTLFKGNSEVGILKWEVGMRKGES